MTPESFFDPKNQALINVVDQHKIPCAQEALNLFLGSKLFVIIGEPNSGKSTLAGELSNEASRRGIRVVKKKYDDILLNFRLQSGSREEGDAFNNFIIAEIETALTESAEGEIVVFDTVGVGNVIPKDRSVTAVNKTVLLTNNVGLLAVMAPLTDQFNRAFIRVDILQNDPADVLDILEQKYNTVVAGIPSTISKTDMGKYIRTAILGMGQQLHVAQILHEVTTQGLAIRKAQYYNKSPALRYSEFLPDRNSLSLQLKTLVMEQRLNEIPLPEDAKILVINFDRGRRITLYAEEFLPSRRHR